MLLEEIFEIISTMNKSEKSFFKRYCKLYSNNATNRNYLLLYEEIHKQVKQKAFDKKKLLKIIHRKIDSKYLTNHTQYLHQQLRYSLLNYHKNNNSYFKLHSSIQANLVLHEKGLYAISARLLAKAKKDALTSEHFSHLLSIITIESSIVSLDNLNNQDLITRERKHAIHQYDEFNGLHLLYRQCMALCIQEFSFHPKDDRLHQLYHHPSLVDVDQAASNKARIYILMIRSFLKMMTGSFQDVVDYERQIIELIHNTKLLTELTIVAYHKILYSAIQLKDEATYCVC